MAAWRLGPKDYIRFVSDRRHLQPFFIVADRNFRLGLLWDPIAVPKQVGLRPDPSRTRRPNDRAA